MHQVVLFLEFLEPDLELCVLVLLFEIEHLPDDVFEEMAVFYGIAFLGHNLIEHLFETHQVVWPFLKWEFHYADHHQQEMLQLALFVR